MRSLPLPRLALLLLALSACTNTVDLTWTVTDDGAVDDRCASGLDLLVRLDFEDTPDPVTDTVPCDVGRATLSGSGRIGNPRLSTADSALDDWFWWTLSGTIVDEQTVTFAKDLGPDGDNLATYDQCPDVYDPDQANADGDNLGDACDACPDEDGGGSADGCPDPTDTDGDGVVDSADACPDVVGTVENQGCPEDVDLDADDDGVLDTDDACPDEAGSATAAGCPDADSDGVADADDACPGVAGSSATDGCPDSDGDGVADPDDECPSEVGSPSTDGCPDTDGDGIDDAHDACPTEAGSGVDGCPADIRDEMTEDGSVCGDWDFHEYEYAELVTTDGGASYTATAIAYVTWGAAYSSTYAPCEVEFTVDATPDGPGIDGATLVYTETTSSCPTWVHPNDHSGHVDWTITGTDVTWPDGGIGYVSADGGTVTALWNWGCEGVG